MRAYKPFIPLLIAALGFFLTMRSNGQAPGSGNDSQKQILTAGDIDRMMSELSNWGRWGADDQLGTLNLITPKVRQRAAAEVREGVTISLSHTAVKVKESDSPPFEQRMIFTGDTPNSSGGQDYYGVQYHGWTQTHMDALCHIFYKGQMYNGVSQKEVTDKGCGKLSVITMKNGLFVRAVLMDMPRLFGVEYLKGGKAIYPKDLDAWLEKTGTKLYPGDAILIDTGRWSRREHEGAWEITKGSAGLDASCMPWLKRHGVSILGSDLASDVLPSGVDGVSMPVHQIAIVAMGMPILDNCDFEALSRTAQSLHRWSFLLTVAPLAVDGGTGSPINPMAVF
jgi:kynurenine formamidase